MTKTPPRLLWLKCCRASQETASPARLYVAGAAIAVMSIVDWLIMKGWVPFLAPLGIALVIGTVIAAFAVRTSSPSAGDDTTGGPTESLPRWATTVIWVLVVSALLIPAVLFMIAILGMQK